MRRMGELLVETEKHKGAISRFHDGTTEPIRLADIGIEKTQSHRYQRIAGIEFLIDTIV